MKNYFSLRNTQKAQMVSNALRSALCALRSALCALRSAFFPSAFSLTPFSLGAGAPRRHRRGIALLVVIGLTAMLMLLGAAFAIYMRTERLASGNFKNDVRARQLLHVALARAMDDVEIKCGGAIYPPWDVLYSKTNDPAASGGRVDYALTGWGATNYLPRGAFVTSSWDTVNANVGWQTKIVGQSPTFSGENVRYAYVVLNVSGLFDANQVGLDGIRGAGTNVQEIDLNNLADANTANYDNGLRPFQTVPDLFAATGATNNFVVFQPYLRTNQLVDLSGDLDTPTRRAEIINALKACGITSDPDNVYSNLLDYVDTDNIPKNLASACTEKVPMINEIRKIDYMSLKSTGGVTNLECRSILTFECWYPFGGNPGVYWLTYQVTLSNSFTQTSQVLLPGNMSIDTLNNGFSYADADASPKTITTLLPNEASKVRIDATVSVQVHEGDGGPIVDASPYPYSTTQTLFVVGTPSVPLNQMTAVGSPPGSPPPQYAYTNGLECIDPRCNWLNGLGLQWNKYSATTLAQGGTMDISNRINQRTLSYCDPSTGWKPDVEVPTNNAEMYVANRPLVSVGELTYLMRSGMPRSDQGDLWTTIHLVPPPGDESQIDPIFDHFTIGTKPTAPAIDWDLVNANSRNSNIWEAVFTDMSVNRPGKDPGFLTTNAAALAAAWLDASDGTMMSNVTDFCRVGWADHGFCTNSIFDGLTSLEKESFFINTGGLLGVRQNTFVILLYGEPTRNIYQGTAALTSPLSGIRAVATVWRDPMAAAPGEPHHWFVRSLDILENE